MLCSRRAISVAFHVADDGDSGAGCGRAADSRGVAAPGAGDSGGRRISRRAASSTALAERRRSLRLPMEQRAFRAWNKIVGPGNRYVTAAKKLVAFDCAIEFLAGPTEAVFISENGESSVSSRVIWWRRRSMIPTRSASSLRIRVNWRKPCRPKCSGGPEANPIAAKSLSRRGAILLVDSLDEAVETANRIAPEHLTLPAALVPQVQNAGSIFLNEFTPQSAGDYISGPNHVLPTGAMARVRGGLSVLDFVRIISCQEVSREGIRAIARTGHRAGRSRGLARTCGIAASEVLECLRPALR